jgi:general secretion pathway protein K
VRGEAERTSTGVDGVRSYYLATGAIERAMVWMLWTPLLRNPDGTSPYYNPGLPMVMQFPTGLAMVEVIPETAKININQASAETLRLLLAALGAPPDRALAIAEAIVDWRTPVLPGALSLFDPLYLAQSPSFRARHASFEEIEELLSVHGVTPDLYYGTFDRDPQTGRLVARPGLADCLSVFGSSGQYDVNTTQPAVLLAAGMPPEAVRFIIERRRVQPFQGHELASLTPMLGPMASLIRLGGNTIFQLRATARLRTPDGRLSDLRRTAAALVKAMPVGYDAPYHILRWYDFAWAPYN